LSYLPSGYSSFVLGTFTVIIGIAAQPFLENVIAGIVISIGQPFRIRDTVTVDGEYGTVELIALTYTVIRRWDWVRYVIPNSILFKKEFLNYTLIDNNRLTHVEFWVSPEADLETVKEHATEAVRDSSSFVPTEDPSFWVMELGKEGIRCWVAGWTSSPLRSWSLTHDVRTQLATSLREEGITFHQYTHSLHPATGFQIPGV
jgi:moderate conductance mechanosensitive channel